MGSLDQLEQTHIGVTGLEEVFCKGFSHGNKNRPKLTLTSKTLNITTITLLKGSQFKDL